MPGGAWGLAAGVTRGRGVGRNRGDRLGVGVAVALAVAVGVALGVIGAVAVGVAVAVGIGPGVTLGLVVGVEFAVGVGTSAGSLNQLCIGSPTPSLFSRYITPMPGGACASAWLEPHSRIAATIAERGQTSGRKYTMPVDLFIPCPWKNVIIILFLHSRIWDLSPISLGRYQSCL